MTLLPEPVPLDPPAGSPEAVDDAARASSGAARLLDELTERLAGARSPAWHGADADAAATRARSIADLAAEVGEALHRIAVRLGGHADVLREVCARTTTLRAVQEDDFAVARSRVAVPFDPLDPTAAPPDEVLAALDAAEADRAAEHARLTARVADDAAETVRVLTAGAGVVAGTRQYDPETALLRLAGLLPAWGTAEVARHGALLALAVRGQGPDGEGLHADELTAAARSDLDLAADPAYAAAFLAALGPQLAKNWLIAAWSGATADDARTELFARVLSALDRQSSGPSWLPGLLDAAAETGELGMVAGGLGAVLARSRATGLAGPPPALAGAWTRSLTREERASGHPVDVGVRPAGADPAASDPLAMLGEAMLEQRAVTEVARTMADPDAWVVVLSRSWNDSAVRDGLVAMVAEAPAEVAAPALRSGLVALGTGLADGDPDDWAFVEDRVEAVAPVLATGWLQHPEVLVGPLAAVATGAADAASLTALRGLAVTVALDEGPHGERAGVVGDRIARALTAPRPEALGSAGGSGPASLAVPAAFTGVREHGARLVHAAEQHRLRDEAEAKAHLWDWTFGLGFTAAGAAPGWGRFAAGAEALVTDLLGTDGSYENSRDEQRHHPGTEALAGGVPGLEPGSRERAAAAREAVLTHARTLAELGTPLVPLAPDDSLLEKVAGAVASDVAGGIVGRRLRVPEGLDGVVGGVVVDRATEVAGGFEPVEPG